MPRREMKPTDVRLDLDAVEFPSERYARLDEEREMDDEDRVAEAFLRGGIPWSEGWDER